MTHDNLHKGGDSWPHFASVYLQLCKNRKDAFMNQKRRVVILLGVAVLGATSCVWLLSLPSSSPITFAVPLGFILTLVGVSSNIYVQLINRKRGNVLLAATLLAIGL